MNSSFARSNDIRTSFHPDQFVVIASVRADVRQKSLEALIYQSMVAEGVGADVINIHAGGAYGDKEALLKRLMATIKARTVVPSFVAANAPRRGYGSTACRLH